MAKYPFPALIPLLVCHPDSYPIVPHEIGSLQQVGPGTGMLIYGPLPNMGQPCQMVVLKTTMNQGFLWSALTFPGAFRKVARFL